jgi:hypothetical protein
MGAGIALLFKKKFGNVHLLRTQNPQIGSFVCLKQPNGIFVYYLITKKYSRGYPKLSDLTLSLIAMKNHALENDIKMISMPCIGSGLDRLPWEDVRKMITEVFEKSGIDIIIYYL